MTCPLHTHKLKIPERRENYTIFLLFIVGIPLNLRWNRTIREVWGHDGRGGREARGTRWVLERVGAMAPCWVWCARPIRSGAGSNVIRRWCGRGCGVCVQRGLVCGVGGLNKVGARHVGASWRRLG